MAWHQLLNLQESNPNELDAELANRAKMVTALICGTFKLGNVFAKELVFDICTRLDINSFEIPLPSTCATVQGVYSLACMVEHSCIPTGHRCFNSDMSITVRSAYGAEEGDAVCICYRCEDSTENGTYLSAIKCTKKCPGYFLPEKPLDCESKWKCEECGIAAPAGYHEMANSKVAEAISKIEEEGLSQTKCEKFL